MLDSIDHRKLLNNDRDTVEQFLAGLEELALAIALHRYRFSQADAEDILLEVLRKLWQRNQAALRAWRGQGSLRAYLAAIVHRFCLMDLRRRRRRVVEQTVDSLDGIQAAPERDPLEWTERRRLWRQAAADLSERDRRLLQLRFIEEKDYAAITAELGLSHGAARKALHTAVSRLRERLRSLAPELFSPGVRS